VIDSPQVHQNPFELFARRRKVFEVDDDLRDLREVAHPLESVSYSRRHVVRQQSIQRLGSSQLGLATASDEKQTTRLAEDLVNVDVMLRDAVGELVELVDEVADVDTAHGICLGERHLLGEALPEVIGIVSVTRRSQK
jgi:hypothetical protein